MEIICFVLRGNTWIGHVQWKCFFGKKKKQRHTLIVHVQWKLLFFERRKKQRNVWIDHVQWTFVFCGKKAKKQVHQSCAVESF